MASSPPSWGDCTGSALDTRSGYYTECSKNKIKKAVGQKWTGEKMEFPYQPARKSIFHSGVSGSASPDKLGFDIA